LADEARSRDADQPLFRDNDPELLETELPALHRASIIWHRYTQYFPDDPLSNLSSGIREALYRRSKWNYGDYASALILMCDALTRAAQPVEVKILTTNYDDRLEQLATDGGLIPAGQDSTAFVPVYLQAADTPAVGERDGSPGREVQIVYLHGKIDSKGGPHEGKLIFSELDYLQHGRAVVDFLVKEFANSPVLILGSSLEDNPLLEALAKTKDSEKAGQGRWAIYPRAAAPRKLDVYRVTAPETLPDPLVHLANRAQQFGLELIVPDFFSQATQFLREVARARALMDKNESYAFAETGTDYDTRLSDWWREWFIADDAERQSAQASCSQNLHLALDKVRTITGDLDERLKIELWVRWGPDHRSLLLWASSTGTWPDYAIARRVSIEADSKHAAARAFATGEVLLDKIPAENDRWDRYFAVPIRPAGVIDSQVLGVIALAPASSSSSGQTTKISTSQPAILGQIGRYLRAVGRDLLRPQ
jgi:hypothetical protein